MVLALLISFLLSNFTFDVKFKMAAGGHIGLPKKKPLKIKYPVFSPKTISIMVLFLKTS